MIVNMDATPLTITSGGLRRYVSELSHALTCAFPADRYLLSSDQSFDSQLPRLPAPKNWLERRWWLCGAELANARARVTVFHGTNFAVPYLARRPSVMTVHDLSPWMNPEWHSGARRVRKTAPRMIRLATMIVTPSCAVKDQLIARFGVAPARVVATPLAASAMFRPVAGSPPKPYFLFVGTLEPRKNVGMLIEAWRALRRESDADLMLVGRRREDFPPLPAEPGLLVLGETPEEALPGLYSSALAVIYPSQYEGFGLPVLEAMQSGAPVIVSRDPALTEVSGGAAVQVSTAPELYAAMREVLRNPEFRAAQSAKSLARAKQFSWPDTALRTHEVYEEAVARFAS